MAAKIFFMSVLLAQVTTQTGLRSMQAERCCAELSGVLGSKVVYPQSTTYKTTIAQYWALQESQLSPSCIVVPTSATDVAKAVSVISQLGDCQFAIKGQGHAPAAGAANINNGVTIDMTQIKAVTLNAEKTVASVGAGAAWVDVYLYLDTKGVAVAGGRNGAVGVGGLLLGGGISFFAPRVGWACDTVVNYEIVLASGELVNANAKFRPDLWRALKGGSNNFGVVTRFDLATIPQGDLFGGFLNQPFSSFDAVLKAFVNIASSPHYDPYTSIVSTLAFVSVAKSWFISHLPTYTKPVAKPPVYEELLAIPQLSSTLRVTNLSDLAIEENPFEPGKPNEIFFTGTYGVSLELLHKIFELSNTTIYSIFPKIPGGIIWGNTFEPLPTAITKWGDKKGGNSLGTRPSQGNAFIMLLGITFNDTASIPLVEEAGLSLFKQIDATAESMGLKHEYQYLNYANYKQQPLQSYGKANSERLQAASRKYDPKGVFQKQVPGGFKLGKC